MAWSAIVQQCKSVKEPFDKPTSTGTMYRHLRHLVKCTEEIRIILNVNYERLTATHKIAAAKYFQEIRGKILAVVNKRRIDIQLKGSFHETVDSKYLIIKKLLLIT